MNSSKESMKEQGEGSRASTGDGEDAVQNVSSQQEKEPSKSQASPPTVPDGGFAAWSTVLGCALAFFASFGFVTGFGVFQSYYEGILPDYSSDDISWIGSFQLWCITGMAIPSVILNAHIGPHITLGIGTFFTVFGVMMASLATKYYQLLLSHGICAGIGIGLTFLPIVGLPNQWFSKKRGLAVGLAIGGSSIGGVIWPIMANTLLNFDKLGFPWTMRAIGFVQLGVMAAAIALIRNNVPRNKAVKFTSFPFAMALKSLGVDLMAVGLLLHFLGIYVPYFYASLYAEALGATPYTAFYVSAALNAATFFGRLVMGAISDKLGASNTLVFSVLVSAIIAFAWQAVNSTAGIFVWAVFYGWFSGASISLQSPAMFPLIPGGKIQLIGPYIAILCQISSFGSLAGNPIAGALLHLRHGSKEGDIYKPNDFYPMMWFTGAVLLGAVLFYQLARYTHHPNMLAKA